MKSWVQAGLLRSARALLRTRRGLLLTLFTSVVCGLVTPQWGHAQQADVSPQLLQLFDSLPPAQQQALIQRVTRQGGGVDLNSIAGPGSSGAISGDAARSVPPQWQFQQQLQQPEANAPVATVATLKPNDTVLLDVMLHDGLSADEKRTLQGTVALIRAHNPYRLDRYGQLELPGFASIAIAGLTEELASRRVASEPAMAKLQVKLTLLPLQKQGNESLAPFGYDMFENSRGFMAQDRAPVPSDYVIGPGDVLQVQLFGSQSQTLNLTVSREGRISILQLGPVEVAGLHYSEVKKEIEDRIARQMIGVHADVSLGAMRTIEVFVLGEVKYPGSYTVSGLATVTSALFAAGGINRVGSLRTIDVKREGTPVRKLDLYDLLIRGDSSNDIKLLPGDVVLVPPVGPTTSLDGEVQRPGIYELKGNVSVSDLIRMGGGLTANADRNTASVVRVDERQRRVVLDVNPSGVNAGTLQLRNGDALHVLRLRPQIDLGVTLQGYVYRPKYCAWHEGLRLTDVVPTIDELKNDADQHYLLIRRELPPNRRVAVLSADLAAALRAPGSAADIPLKPRDTVTVFDLQSSREHVIAPLMEELRLQSSLSQPTEIVHVEGNVKVPGDYPLEPSMRVSDLVRAAAGLEATAYGARAELSRYIIENGEQRRTQVLSIDLAAVRSGKPGGDVALQPYDRLSIKQVSDWSEHEELTLRGAVRFPGVYTIKRNETLRSVIERAGGLTDQAFPEGSVFLRRELREREQEQIERLTVRMRTDIAETALAAARGGQANSNQTLGIGETLLGQLQAAQAVGRLVIDLPAILRSPPGSSDDVILRDGDELIVPRQRQDVIVIGEVQNASSHLYKHSLAREDYIEQSGGFTRHADRAQIYVVRADGSVDPGPRTLFHGHKVEIRPGDAIVVPLNTDRVPSLTLWQTVTQIIYNTAIAAAAVHSL